MVTTPTEIGLAGLLCLLLLILMLTVAERKARTAISRRQRLMVRDVMTPEELSAWRARGQKAHSDEVEALKKLDEDYGKAARTRSGEWRRVHEEKKEPE